MYDWLMLPIDLPPSMTGNGTQTPTPVFRSGVCCPEDLQSLFTSCPNAAIWISVIALGAFALGYYVARK